MACTYTKGQHVGPVSFLDLDLHRLTYSHQHKHKQGKRGRSLASTPLPLLLSLCVVLAFGFPIGLASTTKDADERMSWREETLDFSLSDQHSNDVAHSLVGPRGELDGSRSPVTLTFHIRNMTVQRQFFAVPSPVHRAEVSVWDGTQWQKQDNTSNFVYQTRNRDSVLTVEGGALSALIKSKHLLYDLKFLAPQQQQQQQKQQRIRGAPIVANSARLQVTARVASTLLPKKLLGQVPPPFQRRANAHAQASSGPSPRIRTARRLAFAPDELEQWTDCYAGEETEKQLDIGIVVAPKLYLKWGSLSEAKAFVASIVAKANMVYEPQLNVALSVSHLNVITSYTDAPAYVQDESCSLSLDASTTNDQLTEFSRKSTGLPDAGLWQLLDNCFDTVNGGVAGLAWTGALCQYEPIGSYIYNKGVVWYDSDTWLTFAHEVGHGLGAGHTFDEGVGTTGGIMDYGDGMVDGIYQFNTKYSKEEMCSVISGLIDSCEFLKDATQTCGNGIKEGDEECECEDGSTSCTFCTDCSLDECAECSPDDVDGQCCTSSGEFAGPSVGCLDSAGAGYCSAGVCYSDVVCNDYDELGDYAGVTSTNTCRYLCSGYNRDKITASTGEVLNNFPDGTACGSSLSGTCSNGVCSEANIKAAAPTLSNSTSDTSTSSSSSSPFSSSSYSSSSNASQPSYIASSYSAAASSSSATAAVFDAAAAEATHAVDGCTGYKGMTFFGRPDIFLAPRTEGRSFEECRDACRAADQCGAFSHAVSTGECHLWSALQLKEHMWNEEKFETYMCQGWATAADCEPWHGMVPGKLDTSLGKKVACTSCEEGNLTLDQCDAQCKDNPECHVFTYGKKGIVEGYCELWNSDTTLRDLMPAGSENSLSTYFCPCRGVGKACSCHSSSLTPQPFDCRCDRSQDSEECSAGMYCWSGSCQANPSNFTRRMTGCTTSGTSSSSDASSSSSSTKEERDETGVNFSVRIQSSLAVSILPALMMIFH